MTMPIWRTKQYKDGIKRGQIYPVIYNARDGKVKIPGIIRMMPGMIRLMPGMI